MCDVWIRTAYSDGLGLGKSGRLITITWKDCSDVVAACFRIILEFVQVPIARQPNTIYDPPTAHHPEVVAKTPAVTSLEFLLQRLLNLKQKLSKSSTSINGAGVPSLTNAADILRTSNKFRQTLYFYVHSTSFHCLVTPLINEHVLLGTKFQLCFVFRGMEVISGIPDLRSNPPNFGLVKLWIPWTTFNLWR